MRIQYGTSLQQLLPNYSSQLKTSDPHVQSTVMALYCYFGKEAGGLPNPSGPLSEKGPSSSIAAANADVTKVINQDQANVIKNCQQRRAKIRKRASECGIASTI